MAITYKGVRNAPFTVDGARNLTAVRVLVFHFNAGESPLAVYGQTQIPAYGSGHPENSSLKLSNILIDQSEGDEKSGSYLVTLTYTRPAAGNTAQDLSTAPWRRRPYDISIPSQETIVPFQKSYLSGDPAGAPSFPVLNPAGDAYEDATSRYNSILKFSYNVETFNQDWLALYLDSVNESAVTVIDVLIPRQCGRIRGIYPIYSEEFNASGTRQYQFWRLDLEIEISAKPWYTEILARGLYALESAYALNSKYRIYQDKDGTFGTREDLTDDAIPVDEPQRLNLDGTLFNASLTGGAYQIFFDKFYADWRPLNLPQTTRG